MPIYEYECSRHGIFEEVQSINDEPRKTCPLPFLAMPNISDNYFERCGRKIKRLISGGIGIAMDTDKLWEPDPTSHKPKAERKSDLKKHEAHLFGVPQKDRDRFRGYSRGKGDPRQM